ncbi:hypothetical protein BGZ60DRAFT_402737 [Tricladium varicosporioides]|nr:hypothetical protein BGZ60DRAFT_402737 [Hymenoscyphus varicosporioides]
MDCFKSILHLLGVPCHPVPSHLKPRPAALELSEFSKLPPELTLYIARFLPLESTLSFSLCCRPIYFMFGSQAFKNLGQNSQCFEFLTLLARDLPNHVPCYYCKKLHAIKTAQQHIFFTYRHDTPWLPCWNANYSFTFFHLHKNFSFTVFQMAMKRYRQGLNYSELLNLLSYKETHYQDGYVKHYTALGRVAHGSMIVREQKIVMVPLAKSRLIQGIQQVTVCPHISLSWNLGSHGLHGLVERVDWFRWGIPRVDWNWQGLVRVCPCCLCDYSLEFVQFEGKAEAVFVTKWQDLGQGRSPMDYKWQSHVGHSKEQLWRTVELDRGSVCAMFEGERRLRFESTSLLTQQDRKELLKLLEHT